MISINERACRICNKGTYIKVGTTIDKDGKVLDQCKCDNPNCGRKLAFEQR